MKKTENKTLLEELMTFYTKQSMYCIALSLCIAYGTHALPSYQQWKKEQQLAWTQKNYYERCDRSKDLVIALKPWFRGSKPTTKDLYSYNLLKELWQAPPIKATSDMSREWLRNIEEQRMREYFSHENPSSDQQAWLERAKNALGVADAQVALGSTGKPFMAFASSTALDEAYIALDESPNKKHTIFTAYHECGHIAHGDEPYAGTRRITPESFIEAAENKALIEKVKTYKDKAQAQLDTTTKVGKTLLQTLSQYKKLWQEPKDKYDYNRILQGRIQEQKADLAAFVKLFEEKQFDIMFYMIHLWATQTGERAFVATGTEFVHPSYTERALYLLGFLVEQGIDVNAALQAYEKIRVTKSVFKDMNMLIEVYEKLSKDKKVSNIDDFLKVYEDLKKGSNTIDKDKLFKAFESTSKNTDKDVSLSTETVVL